MEVALWVAVGLAAVALVYLVLTPSTVPADIAQRVARAEAQASADFTAPTEPRPMAAAGSAPAAGSGAPLRDFTVAELARYNGVGGADIYLGVDGYVFNMSSHPSGPDFYGPGKGYGAFAGR